jgi:predicted permease
MSTWRFWQRRSRDQRLDDELRDHMERQYQDYLDDGLSPGEARRRVGVEFGSLELAKDECRDVRAWAWLTAAGRDVRIGMRALARERLFALSVTSILTVGLGTTVAMFSVLHAVVLRPLPYARPHELAVVATHRMLQNQFDGTSGANFVDWRRDSRAFAGMTLFRRTTSSQVVFTAAGVPQRAQEGLVDGEFFPLLGVRALVGRTFSAEESARGDRVVVLSEALWQVHFGGSEDAIGDTLLVAGTPHRIVGVMPRSFRLPTSDTRLWRPLSLMGRWPNPLAIRDGDQFEVLGRLHPGVDLDAARAEMAVIAARLRAAHEVDAQLDVRVTPLSEHVLGPSTRRGLWLGFAAVGLLLAIACANAGGLLAARAARRRSEFAVRSALGAGRGRIVRQLLAEHLALWMVASASGVLLAAALLRLFLAQAPAGIPRLDQVQLDLIITAAAFLTGLVVVMICGSVPAVVAARVDSREAFRARDQAGSPRLRLQRALVGLQIAGATTLSILALLLAQSVMRIQQEDPGYPAADLLIARIERPTSPRFFADARERLLALPGVAAVGAITDFFIRRAGDQEITIDGRAFADADGRLPKFVIDSVTPGYFEAMDIRILEGRDFHDADLQAGAAPVAIVSGAVARRYWPGESAVGQRIVSGSSVPVDGRWWTVVGVVDDLRRERLDIAPVLATYVPSMLQTMDLTIRTTAASSSIIAAVQRELRVVDPSLPVPAVVTAEGRLWQQLAAQRFQAQAVVGFAAIALAFAAAGLYAALAYHVTLRRREIGIRTALGAQRRSIVALFVRASVALTVVSVAIGIGVAALLSRVLQGLLYNTAAVDVTSYFIAAGALALMAMLAAWRPARQAARVDPLAVLRE